jgi:hypothetical protein
MTGRAGFTRARERARFRAPGPPGARASSVLRFGAQACARRSRPRVARLRVTAVELYEHGVVVFWHFGAPAGGDPEANSVWDRLRRAGFDDDIDHEYDDDEASSQLPETIGLGDDVGTRYVAHGGKHDWSGGERTTTGHNTFAPAVPAEARYVDVSIEGKAVRIDLPWVAARAEPAR